MPKSCKCKYFKKLKSNIVFKILIILIFSTSWANAQKAWTLEECINQALANNISVQQQKLQTMSVKADVLQSKMTALPSLNAQASNNWQTGFNINPKTNLPEDGLSFRTNSFGAQMSMPLFNGFQTSNNMRLQASNFKSSKLDLEATKEDVIINVSTFFLRVLQSLEAEQSATARLKSAQAQMDRTQKLYDLGGTNKSKLLQLSAQLAAEEMAVQTASNQLRQAYLQLWLYIDVTPDEKNSIINQGIDEVQMENELLTPEIIYGEYLKNSPLALASSQRVRSSEISRFMAFGGRSPRVSLTGSLNSFYSTLSTKGSGPKVFTEIPVGYWYDGSNPVSVYTLYSAYSNNETVSFSEQFKKNLGTGIGLSFSVPIFNSWSVNTNISKTTIALLNAKLNEKQVSNTIYKNIVQAHNDFRSALANYGAGKKNFDANKEALDFAQKQFDLGALGVSDYLLSKNNFIKAESDFLQAKYELIFRRQILNFYKGKSLLNK